MQLKLGIMTNKELAEWFGIGADSFRNYRKKKLEELKNFAEFEELRGKVNITKIIIPTYMKLRSKAYQRIKDEVDKEWSEDGLDSCSRVSLKIEEKLKNELTIAPSTIYDYTRQSRNELYGIPFQERGSIGSCVYLWCKKQGDGINTEYSLLTPEEEELKQTLIKKYFGDATEKQIIVKGMVEMGEIRREEAWSVLEELTGMNNNNFIMFLSELQAKIGCQIVRGTLVDRDVEMIEDSAF